jgi:uncharacterized membrane protein
MKKILFVGETCTISQTYTKGYDHVTISRYAEAGRSMVDALKENGSISNYSRFIWLTVIFSTRLKH